jgi:hypothetical protein
VAAWQECGLLGSDDGVQGWAKAIGKHFGQETVIGVQECDGAVVGNIEWIPLLVQSDQGTIQKVSRCGTSAAYGSENSSKHWQEHVTKGAVQLQGDAIWSWRPPGGGAVQSILEGRHSDLCSAEGQGGSWGELDP